MRSSRRPARGDDRIRRRAARAALASATRSSSTRARAGSRRGCCELAARARAACRSRAPRCRAPPRRCCRADRGRACRADLVVMGAVSRSRLRGAVRRQHGRAGARPAAVRRAGREARATSPRSCLLSPVRQVHVGRAAARDRPTVTVPAPAPVPYTRRANVTSATVLLISAQPADQARLAERARRHPRPAVPARGRRHARRRHGARQAGARRRDPAGPRRCPTARASPRSCASSRRRPTSRSWCSSTRPRKNSAATPWRAARSTTCDARALTPQIWTKVLRYATERTHTLLGAEGVGAALPRTVPERHGRRVPDHPDGKFMAANPALVRMLGYDSEDELLELDVARDVYMDPDHRDNWMQDDGRRRRGPQRRAGAEAQGRHKIVVLENSRAVRDADGRDAVLRRHAHRHHRRARAVAAALVRRESRPAHRARQPSRVRAAAAARARARRRRPGRTHAVLLHGPRPLQDGQRHLRPRRGRRAAAPARPGAAAAGALGRRRGAPRRRRVRGAAAQLRSERTRVQVADNLLQGRATHFEFIWGTHRFTLGVSIGVVAIDPQLQAHRAGDERRGHRLLCGQGRRAQPRRTSTRKTMPLARAAPRRDGVGGARQAGAGRRTGCSSRPSAIASTGQPGGGRACRTTSCWCACATSPAASCRPGAFLPAVERYNLSVRYDRWVIATALHWMRRHPEVLDAHVALLHQPVARFRDRPGHGGVRPAGARREPASIRGASVSRRPRASRSAISARPTS